MLGTQVGPEPRRTDRYLAPKEASSIGLWRMLDGIRTVHAEQSPRLRLPGVEDPSADGPTMYYAGDLTIVRKKCVAVVGSRAVSKDGAVRAWRLSQALAEAGIVVVSGLAEGVDFQAHGAAIAAGGRTIAVIGTPLEKCYPAVHRRLQETIYREHLLISPFPEGAQVYRSSFPHRNKAMATISDATVIIEASDTSGTLHQAAECQPRRSNRPLFLPRSLVNSPAVTWPAKFVGTPNVHVFDNVDEIVRIIVG